jgi:hypothetical protein
MTKRKKNKPPKDVGTPAKQNRKAAAQRRQVLRSHYAAKYRVR